MRHMDSKDLEIAKILANNSLISNREIAKKLDISDTNVGSRIKKLIKNDSIYFPTVINIKEFPDNYMSLVGIILHTSSPEFLNKCIKKIDNFPTILFTLGVTGHFDLFSLIFALSKNKLKDIIFRIDSIEEVDRTETFLCIDSSGIWIPADKVYMEK